jgi:hypothetical protein
VTTPIVCARCAASIGPGSSFCSRCGTALGPAQRSTAGRLQALVAGGDGRRLGEELDDTFGRLRARADAPDELLEQGRRLADLVARWDVLEGERGAVLVAATAWTRAVGKFLTGG